MYVYVNSEADGSKCQCQSLLLQSDWSGDLPPVRARHRIAAFASSKSSLHIICCPAMMPGARKPFTSACFWPSSTESQVSQTSEVCAQAVIV